MGDYCEKVFFFPGSKNRNLLGFLHLPSSETVKPAILYCHPFADEMNLSHRVTVETARLLTENGHPVLRFHMSGCGDSEGELDEVTIDDWEQDIAKAVEWLKDTLKTNLYGLWGLRLGGGLALLHEMKFRTASFLILWQPVVAFSEYIRQFLRRKAILQLVEKHSDKITLAEIIGVLEQNKLVNAMGYPITESLYKSFLRVDHGPRNFASLCPTLLMSISMMERPNFPMKEFCAKLQMTKARVNFQHVNAEPFWDRYWQWESKIVAGASTEWLQNIGSNIEQAPGRASESFK
jgi:exosortase A-associated hydrolase 2